MSITIFTDGACCGNPGKGSWAGILIERNSLFEISGKESQETTNNRMEMKAVIESLNKVKDKEEKIYLYTDSKYIKEGILWLQKWKQNNWCKADKKKVKNIDMWKEIDKLNENLCIEWKWVKGHSDSFFNNYVDKVAHKALDK